MKTLKFAKPEHKKVTMSTRAKSTCEKATTEAFTGKFGKVSGRKLSKSGWKKKAWAIFSQFIRLRDCRMYTLYMDWGKCYTCQKDFFFRQLQAGHFVQGRHNSVLFDEINSHAQCVNCNIFLHGNLVSYYSHMLQDYGQNAIDDLIERDKQLKPMTAGDYQQIYETYVRKVKELEGGNEKN